MTKDLNTLAIVGAGAVGTSMAYAALIRGSAPRVVLYDLATAKVDAEVKDLSHGTQYTASTQIDGGDDVAVVKDAAVVIITAGARQQPGQSRLDLAAVNANIMKSMMPKLLEQAPDAVYVLVTNPCDVLTVVAQKVSGLPTSRVFSTGTMLDTARLRWMLAQKAGVAQRNVHAMIVGEHGDSEFPLWSTATIGQTPLLDWKVGGKHVFAKDDLEELEREAVYAAYSIIAGKGATNYAIGLTGARLTEAILSKQSTILPLSSVLEDYVGITDVALSVPTLVSGDGVEKVLEVPMTDAEIGQLRESAFQLRATLDTLGF